MGRFSKSLELWADRLIMPALLAIVVIVILEIFFYDIAHQYHFWIEFVDVIVIGIFCVDLSFKFQRARSWEGFVRKYWLEIIAVIPIFLIFRLAEIVRFSMQSFEIGQHILHLVERSGRFAAIFRSAEFSRSVRFAMFIRGFSRLPRLAMAAHFFEEPGDFTPDFSKSK